MYRFGKIARDLGYVKSDQVEEAAERQRREIDEASRSRPIGAILEDMGYLRDWEIRTILECQRIAREMGEVVCGCLPESYEVPRDVLRPESPE